MQRKVNNFHKKLDRNLLDTSKYVFAFLLFCGFNFKMFNFLNNYRFLPFLYCSSLITIMTIATYYCNEVINAIQVWSLVEYFLCVIILTIYNSKISELFSKLSEIDTMLRVNARHYFVSMKKMLLSVLLLVTLRIVYTTIDCIYHNCFTHMGFFIISLFSPFALDMYRALRFSLLDIFRYRIQLLHIRLKQYPECDGYIYISKNKIIKENNIKFATKLYRKIADLIDLIRPELFASMFVSICCSIPKLVIDTYRVLLVLQGKEPMGSIGFLIMHMTQVCFLLFSPCIVVELILIEEEKIRLYLMHLLLKESDPSIKEDIQEFLQYIEVRNFQYKIWRIIPLNVALPIEITNICINCIIVAINYTHLYG